MAFLDEPTSGVDVNGRDTIRAIIKDLAGKGCAVVLATHELNEAERLADRAVIFDGGRVIADGTIAELRQGHDEIRFRSTPHLDLAGLAAAIGMVASEVGDGEYVIDAPPHPRLMAQLAGWLAEQGLPLDDVRGGAQRLEDVFRRLTATEPRRWGVRCRAPEPRPTPRWPVNAGDLAAIHGVQIGTGRREARPARSSAFTSELDAGSSPRRRGRRP